MTRNSPQAGVTLVEVLVVVAILGLSIGAAAVNLAPMESPLSGAVALTESFLREARLSAIATTSAHRVVPTGANRLGVERAASCSATTWTPVSGERLQLPEGVTYADTTWVVCFTSRGISADNVTITHQHGVHGTRDVEVLLGGTTRVIE